MHHIFARPEQFSDDRHRLRITGEDFHHMTRVLRMKEGEELSVSVMDEADEKPYPPDGRNVTTDEEKQVSREEYRFGIEEITQDAVICTLRFAKHDTAELPVRIILLQGLPTGDKMEQIIEKNTELGVAGIVPVMLKRCVMKLDEKKAASRVVRWNRIAEAAAKQSRRGVIPRVTDVMTLTEALSYAKDAERKLLPYELAENDAAQGMAHTRSLMNGIRPGDTVAVFIGPEGGFEEAEVLKARESGFQTVSLGGRILRTETAGMTVAGWLNYLFG
ncbi:MAG: 16S rRNA (uracil(1498)-N(3))-methyltransferase [Lachnospiraceae bacterium]|nr:16S rRNA (uracil(1498)-N(3))-methyltransferase [Lachnospiraceae bacterium]